jgi:NAD(P)-dependent dehydrogenase (short-subunit alcohol dehydrogenase family)
VEVIAADRSRQAGIDRVAEAAGAIDILVNNAGAIPGGNLLAVDDAALRAGWNLKVFGFISLTRAFTPCSQRAAGWWSTSRACSGRRSTLTTSPAQPGMRR